MYKIITPDDILADFERINRKNMFTWIGCKYIIDYYDLVANNPTNILFNPYDIATCWTEYGELLQLTIDDLLNDYSYLINLTDKGDRETAVDQIINHINYQTGYATRLKNGNVLIQDF